MKKYGLLEKDKKTLQNGATVFRIIALEDIQLEGLHDVKKGRRGGYIEHEDNLSHEGNCWVHHEAIAHGTSRIIDNAQIGGYAEICENAWAKDNTIIGGNVWIGGDAQIGGDVELGGNTQIGGTAQIGVRDSEYICIAYYEMRRDEIQRQVLGLSHDDPLPKTSKELGVFLLGLNGEAGEVSDLVKKRLRNSCVDDPPADLIGDRAKFLDELGDVLWYVTGLAGMAEADLSEVMSRNLEKLEARAASGDTLADKRPAAGGA